MGIKKILVTGSNGYIGAVLVERLLKKGYEVIGVDSLYFKESTLQHIKPTRFLHKDVRKITSRDVENIDAVVHLAALSNDAMGELNPQVTKDINHKATIRLAKLCKKQGVKRFLFSSSCSIYGIGEGVVSENSSTNPITEYAKSKIRSELELNKLADSTFTVVSLRNATVYGFSPSFRSDLVVNNFTLSTYLLNKLLINSDGTPWRPLIDVRDLSDIFIHFLTINKKVINKQIINVGFDQNNFQINDIVKLIKRQHATAEVTYTGIHPDSRSYKVSFRKFSKMLPSLKQNWDLEKSISDLYKNLKKYKITDSDFHSQKFERIKALSRLLSQKKLNEKLFWQRPFTLKK